MQSQPESAGASPLTGVVDGWLPPGKKAAVVWTIDDIHPGRSTDAYEAGGDLERGALRHVLWLLERHRELKVTLFTTADWRQISPWPSGWRARVPWGRSSRYLAPILPRGTMAVDRHPEFVRFLSGMPRTEIALHGLHHVHTGPRIPVEFQDEPEEFAGERLQQALAILDRSGLVYSRGLQPPGWHLGDGLRRACVSTGIRWVASSRDIVTPVSRQAKSNMSGLKGVSLIYPERLEGGVVHFSSNFQATNAVERAHQIVEAGGILAVKAHIVKNACGHVALDGVDEVYMNYLDVLFRELAQVHGDSLWWTSMGEISARLDAVDETVLNAGPF